MKTVLFVAGTPIPWKRTGGGLTRRRFTPKRQRVWGETIAAAWLASGLPVGLKPPYEIVTTAQFSRPPSHYNKSGLKQGAPEWPNVSKGDFDNLIKAATDALEGVGVLGNDGDVIDGRSIKRFVERDRPSGLLIEISSRA